MKTYLKETLTNSFIKDWKNNLWLKIQKTIMSRLIKEENPWVSSLFWAVGIGFSTCCFPMQFYDENLFEKKVNNYWLNKRQTNPSGVLWISSDGDYRMGVKIKTPRKALGLPTQPIPGQQINPPRIPCTHAEFPSLNNLGWFLFAELWARDLRALQRISDCYKSGQPKKNTCQIFLP